MRLHPLLCVALVAAAACGGGSVEIDDFPSRLADAFCKNAVACQSAPGISECKASIQVKNRLFETLIAKVKAKAVGYDEELAGDCVDELASASCAFTGFHTQADSSCAKVFTGTVAAGGACAISFECANQGACEATDPNCDPDVSCCAGTCQPGTAEVPLGGDCTNAQCDDATFCASATNRCTAVIATEGAPCDDLDACANPMVCDVFATTSTCVKPAARGATCNPMLSFFPCADTRDYCDETTMKCTQNVAVGQACEGANAAECIGYARCTNMVCEALALAGATCPAGTASACLGDLDCPNGTCTLAAPQMACPRLDIDPASPSTPPAASTLHRSRPRGARPTLDWMPRL